jgi:hypothetical protein
MRTKPQASNPFLSPSGIQGKSRPNFSNARLLAQVNPDALARNLLNLRQFKGDAQRRELWSLLQNIGGAPVVKRASQTILNTRNPEELDAVLHAAAADFWRETAPAIATRFHREMKRLPETKITADHWHVFQSLAYAASRLSAPLQTADVRALLASHSSKLRAVGAELVASQRRYDLLDETLPLCWDRGEASVFAGVALGAMGNHEHAARLWARTLAARKAGRQRLMRNLLQILGNMGAFDIQVAVKYWIEEDVATAEANKNPWPYGVLWSQLVASKLAANACTPAEAIEDLRWFVRAGGLDSAHVPALPGSDHGRFRVAQQLAILGAQADAEEVLTRFAARGLPSPLLYPQLVFSSLRVLAESDPLGTGTPYLVALNDAAAQKKIADGWRAALNDARWPDTWALRRFIPAEIATTILRESLRKKEPGVLREVLSLLAHDDSARLVKTEIRRLAEKHSSGVVRWKASRLLSALKNAAQEKTEPVQRWVRLDAAILSGAMRPGHIVHAPPAKEEEKPVGVLPPERAGLGYRLAFENLSAAERIATVNVLTRAPLSHALNRELPQGPALEERPDIRAVRMPAVAETEIDERMADMAMAVMSMWNEADEALTLDEEGLRLMAAALCTEARALDEDDLAACGAFIGEVFRKRLGGQWSGYDDNYRLEVPVQDGESESMLSLDPLGWAREIHARKDLVEGTRLLIENFNHAMQKASPRSQPNKFHVNPSAAFEQAILVLGKLPPETPMIELLAESRAFAFRLLPSEWPAVLTALEPLIEGAWVRVAAAFAIYAPGEAFCRLWPRWGVRRRDKSAFVEAILEAVESVVERDDLEAMPHWTFQPGQPQYSFINTLRKRMAPGVWQGALKLLLRQRAAAGDRAGVAWCLYSYKYEFPDILPLMKIFCDMSVSARQTVIGATVRATRDERKLFRALWAEALRDPASAVVTVAIDAVGGNDIRSLRPLVEALTRDSRDVVSEAASQLMEMWTG